MDSKDPTRNATATVIIFAGVAILLLAMRAAGEILSPMLLAMVLAITTSPILYWFRKKGAANWLALLLTIGLNVILIVAFVWLVGMSVQDFGEKIPEYDRRVGEIKQTLGSTLSNLGVDVDNLSVDQLTDPDQMLSLAAEFAGGIVSGLSNWGLILITSVFFLVEATIMPRKMRSVAEDSDPDVQRVLRYTQNVRQFMTINASVGALAAVINTILLLIIGVDFALLWGVLSFFMSFVPNVGFLLSVIPPALMALVQFGVTEMLIVIAAYVIINFMVDNIIKPRFIEDSLNISVTVTFLSLILWGWVLGPIGAILAVPMAMAVQSIFDSSKETRWLAYMMGNGSEPFQAGLDTDQLPATQKE